MAPASEAHRTHPLTGLLQGLIWGAGVMVAVASQVIDDPSRWMLLAIPGGFVLGVLAGYVGWWFLRYVIDDDEIRIERGVLVKSSRRIPFERLQSVDISEPLIARLAGLAELTIEMAGGSDSRTRLRFVTLAEARRLRRLLLARAHGVESSDDTQDESLPRAVLHVVQPDQIIIGTLLSLDFIATVLTAAGAIVAGFFTEAGWAILTVVIPAVYGIVQMISSRIFAQWGFTVSRGERGLRIERGLFSRSSQTIPYDRVQGIVVVEPLVWRRFGWARLDVDVAGYGTGSSTNAGVSSTTLLPIAPVALGRALVDELIPDPEAGTGERITVPRRSLVFAPIGWRYRWLESTSHVVTTGRGWLTRQRSIVPHHKVQSVECSQGPLERRLGLASVAVHTPDGPVNAGVAHVDAALASAVTFEQVEQARRARLSRR